MSLSSSGSDVAEEVNDGDYTIAQPDVAAASPTRPLPLRGGFTTVRPNIFSWSEGAGRVESGGAFMEESVADDELEVEEMAVARGGGDDGGGGGKANDGDGGLAASATGGLGGMLRVAVEETYGDEDFEDYEHGFETESLTGSPSHSNSHSLQWSPRDRYGPASPCAGDAAVVAAAAATVPDAEDAVAPHVMRSHATAAVATATPTAPASPSTSLWSLSHPSTNAAAAAAALPSYPHYSFLAGRARAHAAAAVDCLPIIYPAPPAAFIASMAVESSGREIAGGGKGEGGCLKRRTPPKGSSPERIAALIRRARTLAARREAAGVRMEAGARAEAGTRGRLSKVHHLRGLGRRGLSAAKGESQFEEEEVGSGGGGSGTIGGGGTRGGPVVASALAVARLHASNHAHRVRHEIIELEREIVAARAALLRRLPPAAARAVYLGRALRRAHAAEGRQRAGDDFELAFRDADLACVVADLARSLPRVGDEDPRRVPGDPWDYADPNFDISAHRDRAHIDVDVTDDREFRVAGAELDEEWAGSQKGRGGGEESVYPKGGRGLATPGVTAGVLGKGRQALLRRLWASHRLRQEVEETFAEVKSDAPASWSLLHLQAGGLQSPCGMSSSWLFDVDADDFGAELDPVGAGAGAEDASGGGGGERGDSGDAVRPAVMPPAHIAAMLRDSCALRRHAEAVLSGGGGGFGDGGGGGAKFSEDAACCAKSRVAAAEKRVTSEGAVANHVMSTVVRRRAMYRNRGSDTCADGDETEDAARASATATATVRERIGVGRMLQRGANLRAQGRRLGL
jgi:hypothetical protein